MSARERAERNRADEQWNLRIPVKAGPREVTVTFLNRTAALEETTRLPFLRPYPAGVNIPETRLGASLRSVEISGPHNPIGPGTTPSRQRIFVCRPASPADAACARTILTTLRGVSTGAGRSSDVGHCSCSTDGRTQGGFDAGIERALRRLLVSPSSDACGRDPAGAVPGAPIASATSSCLASLVFLWSSIPMTDAGLPEKQQSEPAILGVVRRLMAEPRADAFVKNLPPWLFLRISRPTGRCRASSMISTTHCVRNSARNRDLFRKIVREDRSASICCAPITRSSTRGWRALRNSERQGQPLPPRIAR